jgi:hypothetical protein
VQFQPNNAVNGATLTIASDSTDRLGTGRSFSSLAGLSGQTAGLGTAEVRREILGAPASLPLARLQTDAAIGQKAIGAGDVRGATAFVERLSRVVDLGKDGVQTLERFSGSCSAAPASRRRGPKSPGPMRRSAQRCHEPPRQLSRASISTRSSLRWWCSRTAIRRRRE